MGMFFSDDDDSWNDALRNNAENRNLYEQIKLPSYDEMVPELYGGESYNYDLINEDPALKGKQMGNLNVLEKLASEGLSAEDELGFMQARQMGAQQAKAGTGAALNDAAARGVSGGGLEFAMREMANQGGAQRSQSAGLEQAAASARQRALAGQAYTSALSQTRGDDYRVGAANTGIMNDFNARNTTQRNVNNNANVDQRNGAFVYNQGLKDKNFNNQIGRADRIAGNNDQRSEIGMARSDQNRRSQQADINQWMNVAGMGMSAYGKGSKDDE
jgi:hypothetical protein